MGPQKLGTEQLCRQVVSHFYWASNEIKPPSRERVYVSSPPWSLHSIMSQMNVPAKSLLLEISICLMCSKDMEGIWQWNKALRAVFLYAIIKSACFHLLTYQGTSLRAKKKKRIWKAVIAKMTTMTVKNSLCEHLYGVLTAPTVTSNCSVRDENNAQYSGLRAGFQGCHLKI